MGCRHTIERLWCRFRSNRVPESCTGARARGDGGGSWQLLNRRQSLLSRDPSRWPAQISDDTGLDQHSIDWDLGRKQTAKKKKGFGFRVVGTEG